MNYFLFSALSFLGLPFPGTLRIVSNAETSYKGDFVLGLMPAVISRCLIVAGFKPNSLAISSTVRPSIVFISENLTDMLNIFNIFAEKLLTKSNRCVRLLE